MPALVPTQPTPPTMHLNTRSLVRPLALAALLATGSLPAQSVPATTEAPTAPEAKPEDVLKLDAFVVTAVARPGTTKMKSSISVSTIAPEKVQGAIPRSTAEIFRNLPGFRSEATSGDGNANITVRGLPLSAGGSRYVQIHEDGVPVLEFGDIAFGTADQFVRADPTLGLLEAVRGGSASTAASNSPGGVINFLSKTGEVAGGSLAYTRGLDFDEDRVEFAYGSPLSDTLRFHVGGFYRNGEGVRDTGFNGNDGGQFKANLTKDFAQGYVRLYLKVLDDHATTYLPMPIRVTRTNANPSFRSPPGFDIKDGTPHSVFFQTFLGIDGAGNPRTGDVSDGIHTQDTALGAEASFDLGGGWRLFDRFNYSNKRGRFISPFPAEVTNGNAIATTVGGAGSSLVFANGPRAGEAFGNGLVMRTVLFDTTLNDFDTITNNLKLDKTFTLPDDAKVNLGLSYYRSRQNINMDWLWNTYLLEVKGDNAALLDVRDAAGALITDRGLEAFSAAPFGNFGRAFDAEYDISAPAASLSYTKGRLNLDASLRLDYGDARGAWFGVTTGTKDVDGNGVISRPETSVSVIDRARPNLINYDWDYTSYSFGANYAFNDNLASFARYSRGGRAGADRIVDFLNPDGSLRAGGLAVNTSKQFELGVKYRNSTLLPGNLGVFATYFHADTKEASNFEATTQRTIQRTYDADGVEVEFAYTQGLFDLRGGLTYTDAEISGADVPALIGNTPRRQAKLVYQITPSLTGRHSGVGFTVIGTTGAFTQDDDVLRMPGYAYINAFANYQLAQNLTLSIGVNNLFNKFGLSESEEGAIPAHGIIRARGITGRSTSLTLRYTF